LGRGRGRKIGKEKGKGKKVRGKGEKGKRKRKGKRRGKWKEKSWMHGRTHGLCYCIGQTKTFLAKDVDFSHPSFDLLGPKSPPHGDFKFEYF